jgi:RNA polymerase sigma-70 factor, ECF subfamily
MRVDPRVDRQTELRWVAGLRAGDTAAFDAVYDAFHVRVRSFLVRLARNRDVADDLADETWLRVVATARRLREDTSLAPWLFTVARHLFLSYCRSRALEDLHTADPLSLWPFAPPSSPFDVTAARQREARLEAALASLPVAYREALLLVGVEGLRPAEAAEVCRVRPEAFRQRLSRARALLAERLASAERSATPVSERHDHDT